MNRVFFDGRDLEIAIRRDGIERTYPLASLAAALRIETAFLRARIDALLNAAEALSTEAERTVPSRASAPSGMLSGEPTEGTVPIRSDAVQTKNILNRSDTDTRTVPPTVAAERARDSTPEALASLLGDVPNTAAIALLVRELPSMLIQDALDQAMAIPATRLRTNRAALFTAIVRRICRERGQPTPYARTETPET